MLQYTLVFLALCPDAQNEVYDELRQAEDVGKLVRLPRFTSV